MKGTINFIVTQEVGVMQIEFNLGMVLAPTFTNS